MQGVGSIRGKKLLDRLECSVPFSKIKRTNDLAAEANDFATGNERTRYRLTEVSIRKAGHRHHRGNGSGDIGRCHNKCGARAGESEFGEAHHMHSLIGPERLGLAENDTGKWPPVGIVNDERDVTLCSDISQVPKLGIRDQIPTGVRGPRDAHRSDL